MSKSVYLSKSNAGSLHVYNKIKNGLAKLDVTVIESGGVNSYEEMLKCDHLIIVPPTLENGGPLPSGNWNVGRGQYLQVMEWRTKRSSANAYVVNSITNNINLSNIGRVYSKDVNWTDMYAVLGLGHVNAKCSDLYGLKGKTLISPPKSNAQTTADTHNALLVALNDFEINKPKFDDEYFHKKDDGTISLNTGSNLCDEIPIPNGMPGSIKVRHSFRGPTMTATEALAMSSPLMDDNTKARLENKAIEDYSIQLQLKVKLSVNKHLKRQTRPMLALAA